ncbi:FAD-dependent 5-carboxymethylaminomethyl-2-thiouridine(34) oxidoreductase MnmC [Shewanella acanthi]|uniref:FAD-dependent 5-carboxymethylaminomethyl-2-thiouridine(34) oxidoreductase MnmC n=1 Tax=Shewanella acanthi TaxID=2864212 RepID=UPI001C654BD6|nr:FAD-dependent 5-carboxymethylaminomethyl-2-thiouridine(34) oxidoreductase MnmC [Shewanella acanthi]QYJ80014.1 FAD-dependent 5-carboxymethylaminomethyl-2-thiouridine(34) oxidoreductase MnmC [Shewanella acanthi]
MTTEPKIFRQIKRDYKQLINLYPQNHAANAYYLDKLSPFLLKDFAESTKPLQVFGQLGLGSGLELLALIHFWQQHSSQRILFKVFEPNPINFEELDSLWQQSELLKANQKLQPIADALINAKPARIVGCQRLLFDDGRITIDLHFGELNQQLTQLPHCDQYPIQRWLVLSHSSDDKCGVDKPSISSTLDSKTLWQMARLSHDDAVIVSDDFDNNSGINKLAKLAKDCGFGIVNLDDVLAQSLSNFTAKQAASDCDDILRHERKVLREHSAKQFAYNPLSSNEQAVNALKDNGETQGHIAIIGGGLAAANLSLSLAERGQSSLLFCKDSTLGQGASGNRQGAIYPLLTSENDELSRFFQQAFLFSRRRIEALSAPSQHSQDSHQQQSQPSLPRISHDFCGVLQTGHDERSQQRLDKIIDNQAWPAEIAYRVDEAEANKIANLGIDKAGFYYPLGGWVCPFEYAEAALAKAKLLADVTAHFNTEIIDITQTEQGWILTSATEQFGPFNQLVLANGADVTAFSASQRLQISPFRGQVSHVPAQFKLSTLATVLCANGYLTPSHEGLHCLGASYVKSPEHLDFCPEEQVENLGKMHESYPNQPWVEDIDISGNSARVGVRMVTRDHFPMMGCAPDVDAILNRYERHQLTKESRIYWQTTSAPTLSGLYILGGLGSRGLSSGPLAAECLAAQLLGEPVPLDWPTLTKLNPNRMWMRKLLKGKSL